MKDFDRVRWTVMSADPLVSARERFRWRQRLGWGPPFVPYSAEQRYDPGAVLDGARSVLTVAVPYWHPMKRQGQAVTSRSSWGADYHDVVQGLVRDVLDRLVGKEAASRAHIQADSGPLEERALAVESGLGYLGSNGSIFVPPFGSWVFLGAAVTDVPINPSTGHSQSTADSGCLQCSKCVNACPTGALFAPHRINHHRCLSYLTQRRGFLAVSLRRSFQGRLFGCDNCQEACPANGEAERGVVAFAPDELDRNCDPLSILQMSQSEFDVTWGAKSAGWRGRRTLRRIAILALANTDERELVTLLAQHLCDPSPIIRGHIAWAMSEIATRVGERLPRDLRGRLADLFACDDDPRVRFEAQRALEDRIQ